MVSRTKKFNDYELVSCFASVRNKMVYLETIGKNTGGSQREKMRDDSESSWMGYQIVLKKLLQLQ